MKKGTCSSTIRSDVSTLHLIKGNSTITNTILMAASTAAKHCRFSPQNTAGHLLVLSMILAMTILPRISMVTGGGISSEWKA